VSTATLFRPVPGVTRNGLPWKPYAYRGEGADTLTPELGDAFDDVPEPPAGPCWCGGDMRGYRKHLGLEAGDPRREPWARLKAAAP